LTWHCHARASAVTVSIVPWSFIHSFMLLCRLLLQARVREVELEDVRSAYQGLATEHRRLQANIMQVGTGRLSVVFMLSVSMAMFGSFVVVSSETTLQYCSLPLPHTSVCVLSSPAAGA
jgi:hypothetical protein